MLRPTRAATNLATVGGPTCQRRLMEITPHSRHSVATLCTRSPTALHTEIGDFCCICVWAVWGAQLLHCAGVAVRSRSAGGVGNACSNLAPCALVCDIPERTTPQHNLNILRPRPVGGDGPGGVRFAPRPKRPQPAQSETAPPRLGTPTSVEKRSHDPGKVNPLPDCDIQPPSS